MFLLKRTDQGGGYVAEPGMRNSYTRSKERARRFPTRDAAEAERCPGNEIIVPL